MIDFLKAAFLGLIEGLTEFLPVSSTGHLILANEFVSFSEDFTKTFDVVIQLGAILAVVITYARRLFPNKDNPLRQVAPVWGKVLVAVIPFIAVGALFGERVQASLFNPIVVAIALAFWGIVIIVFEKLSLKRRMESMADVSYPIALLIGVGQCLAIVPGTSRSAVTIIFAMLLGASRVLAVEFSFFLAVPSLAAACGYSLLKSGFSMSPMEYAILGTGFAVSFVVAWFVIRFFIGFVSKKNFIPFGIYRIALAALVVLYFFLIKR